MDDNWLTALNELYEAFSSDSITRDQFRQGLADHGYWPEEIEVCCREMFSRKYRERKRAEAKSQIASSSNLPTGLRGSATRRPKAND